MLFQDRIDMMCKTGKYVPLLIFILALMLQSGDSIGQSLTGTSGLVTIPTAEIAEDGQISFGMAWLDKDHFGYSLNEYHGLANYITLGYLPFLEVSLRLTRMLDYPKPQAIGDRMLSVRLRPLKETRFSPAIVLGIHDFIWSVSSSPTNNFNALYLSASKGFRLGSLIDSVKFHVGYGVDRLEAENHEFVGAFGGISISPRPFIALMYEYDTEKSNVGLRISFFDRVEFLAALLNLDTFSGGMSCKFKL